MCTSKPGRIFLHVYGQRSGEVVLAGLTNQVTAAYLLADPKRRGLSVRRDGRDVTIQLPGRLPDEAVSVIAVEIQGEPVVDTTIRQGADGRVTLRARDADIHGTTPRYEVGGGKDNIGFWNNPKDYVSWTLEIAKGGEFDVQITYSCAKGAGGSQFTVEVGKEKLVDTSKETGSWGTFKTFSLGRIKLAETGKVTLAVRPKAKNWKVIGLQSVVLRPVK